MSLLSKYLKTSFHKLIEGRDKVEDLVLRIDKNPTLQVTALARLPAHPSSHPFKSTTDVSSERIYPSRLGRFST